MNHILSFDLTYTCIHDFHNLPSGRKIAVSVCVQFNKPAIESLKLSELDYQWTRHLHEPGITSMLELRKFNGIIERFR